MTGQITGRSVCHEDRGFSLIELMVTMAIAGIFFAAITSAFVAQNRGYQTRNEITDMMQNARVAMDLMSRELRAAESFSNISLNSTVSLSANVDGNGIKTLEYSVGVSNGTPVIYRKLGTATKQPLAYNVKSLQFNYYSDLSTDPATTAINAAEVKAVEVVITMQTATKDPGYSLNGGYRTYTLTSFVSPRSLTF